MCTELYHQCPAIFNDSQIKLNQEVIDGGISSNSNDKKRESKMVVIYRNIATI